MTSKIENDLTRLVVTSVDPTLFESNGLHREALSVIALKDAVLKARTEFEIAHLLRLRNKTKRAKKVHDEIHVQLMKRSAKLLRKSDLDPSVPAWIPEGLRRPRMMRYHAVVFESIPNMLCLPGLATSHYLVRTAAGDYSCK